MKKVIIWILFIIVCIVILLTVLISSQMQKQYSLCQNEENIKRIEIISVPQYAIPSNKVLSEMTPIATVDNHQWPEFLKSFFSVPCFSYFNDPAQMIVGNAIRIVYQDGTCELICECAGMYLLPSGVSRYTTYYFDTESFGGFINNWLGGQGDGSAVP